MTLPATRTIEVPSPVRVAAERLARRGARTWLVGETVHDLLLERSPSRWAIACSMDATGLAASFERAVPIGTSSGSFALPSRAGPLEIAPRHCGQKIEDDLARRGFRVLAMAIDLIDRHLLDPYAGLADLATHQLRCVGAASKRLVEAPRRVLQAARLVASEGYEADAELRAAMRAVPGAALRRLPAWCLFADFEAILLAPRAASGLALLRDCGAETALVPGTRPEAAALVGRLPPDLALRLAGWLRGARAEHFLTHIRSDPRLANRVVRLLALHPIDEFLARRRRSALARSLRRLSLADREALIALRESELDCLQASSRISPERAREARRRLGEVADAIGRLRREAATPRPLLRGHEIMRVLGIGPGPKIGAALRFLSERVREAPACNEPEQLARLLRDWARTQPERSNQSGEKQPGSRVARIKRFPDDK